MGLTINTAKTEVICQSVAEDNLSVVPSFRYLGSIISDNNSIDNEVQNRINQTSAAYGRLRRWVFQNKNLHLNTKICVYQAICITTLLYSCEAWVTYSRHIKSLEQFNIRCLQPILGITCRGSRSSKEQAAKVLRPQSLSTNCVGSYSRVSALLGARRNASKTS